jgi:hypothetical protein
MDSTLPKRLRGIENVADDDLRLFYPGFWRSELRRWKRFVLAEKSTQEAKMLKKIKRPVSRQVREDRQQLDAAIKIKESTTRYKEALKELRAKDEQLDAVLKLKETPQSFVISPSAKDGKNEATAFTLASDWHYEEEVRSGTVNGLNRFNLEIADKRISNFFANDVRLIHGAEKDNTIKTHVLALLGDFISGNIHEAVKETTLLDPMDAILSVQSRLVSGIRYLLANTTQNLVVVCHSGNHARITEKVHSATENGNSLEYFMYRTMQDIFADDKRVTFIIAEGYHSYMDVYGWKFRFHHGHAINYGGGVGGLMIPAKKAVLNWNISKPVDYDVFGHFHQQMLDAGNIVTNGSLIGYNTYALRIKAAYEPPRQGFFLVHEKYGKTAEHSIALE